LKPESYGSLSCESEASTVVVDGPPGELVPVRAVGEVDAGEVAEIAQGQWALGIDLGFL
jgi:hypothetical protein